MKRILFLSHRVPYPPDKGERVRAFHEITALAKHFRVTVAALAHAGADYRAALPLKQWCEHVIMKPAGGHAGLLRGVSSLLAGRSITEGYFHSPAMRRALRREALREPFDLVMAYSSGVLRASLDVPADSHIIDLVDVDSAKWESYAEASIWPRSWLYRTEARRVRVLESEAIKRCNVALLVSEDEIRALPGRNEDVLALGNGVDLDHFSPSPGAGDEKPLLVFTGTMDYRPNVEAVCSFVGDVWGDLRKRVPELTFTIVGRNPTRAVERLAEAPGVIVTGAVPDVRPYLAAATAAVVPLRIARGIQNKVLEAMAMGRPVVASGPALEGLDVTPGEDVLQADSTQEWHDQIVRVLSDKSLRRKLGESARKCVEIKYDWDARMAPLVSMCRRLTESGRSGKAARG